jgi:hypothetical protein
MAIVGSQSVVAARAGADIDHVAARGVKQTAPDDHASKAIFILLVAFPAEVRRWTRISVNAVFETTPFIDLQVVPGE